MNNVFATVLFGLAAALCWGSGDFSGGLASRRANATSVGIASYAIGLILMVVLALIWREPFPAPLDILWGGLAGLVGATGLIAFYSALVIGRMGIAAPVSAVLTAGLPAIFSVFTEGWPGLLQVGGFALALLAIGLISRPEQAKGRPAGFWLALLAGCSFGGYFILISQASHAETFWPLAIAFFTSMFIVLVVTGMRRQQVLSRTMITPLVLLAGTLDAIGNVFFVLATHTGHLDVAAVLSSLYPAATVLLAAIVLSERVTRVQAIGIVVALVAVPLISV
jgi:drug/metabolite transporter (DMT)-like permease